MEDYFHFRPPVLYGLFPDVSYKRILIKNNEVIEEAKLTPCMTSTAIILASTAERDREAHLIPHALQLVSSAT